MLVVHLTVFDPDEARQKGRPAEMQWTPATMTEAQRRAGIVLLRKMADVLEKHTPREESNDTAQDSQG